MPNVRAVSEGSRSTLSYTPQTSMDYGTLLCLGELCLVVSISYIWLYLAHIYMIWHFPLSRWALSGCLIVFGILSSPRAKRAGPMGLCAETVPLQWGGGRLFGASTVFFFFLQKKAITRERKVKKLMSSKRHVLKYCVYFVHVMEKNIFKDTTNPWIDLLLS